MQRRFGVGLWRPAVLSVATHILHHCYPRPTHGSYCRRGHEFDIRTLLNCKLYCIMSVGLLKARYTHVTPCRPVHHSNSLSLGSIQPRCNHCAKPIHSPFRHSLWWICELTPVRSEPRYRAAQLAHAHNANTGRLATGRRRT